jgi:hypothetical protein
MFIFSNFYIYTGSAAFKESLPAPDGNGQIPIDTADPILAWTKARTSELDVVNITVRPLCIYYLILNFTNLSQSALIAAVISGAFSWPTIEAAPWTSKGCFYSAIILALTAIFTGSQQSIALHRIGGRSASRLRQHLNDRKDIHLVAYVWQIPVMMLNISIWMLLVGLLILIWDRAASSKIWGGDTKVDLLALSYSRLMLED